MGRTLRLSGIGGMQVCSWCFHPLGDEDVCPGCGNSLYKPPVPASQPDKHKRPMPSPVGSAGRPHVTGYSRQANTSPQARKTYLASIRKDPPIRRPVDSAHWLAELADAELREQQCLDDWEKASAEYRYSEYIIADEHLADRALGPQRRNGYPARSFAKVEWEEARRAWERARDYADMLRAEYNAVHADMHLAPGRRDSIGIEDDDGSLRFGEKLAEISRRNKRR